MVWYGIVSFGVVWCGVLWYNDPVWREVDGCGVKWMGVRGVEGCGVV